MFSGRYEIRKHNERYFIDRDGNVFVCLVNFLSLNLIYLGSGKFPVFKTKIEETNFIEELEFWQINYKQDCTTIIKIDEANIEFDPDWVANTLILDHNNTLVKKQSNYLNYFLDLQHGIVFSKLPMDIYNNIIEFRVN